VQLTRKQSGVTFGYSLRHQRVAGAGQVTSCLHVTELHPSTTCHVPS